MQRTLAIEARRAAELQVSIGAVKTGLIDPHLIAAVSESDRPVILQFHQIVVKRNLVNVGAHFDCLGMAKASRKREKAIDAAVPSQLFQVQAGYDESIHLQLLHRHLTCHLIIAMQADGKFSLQPACVNFRDERYLCIFAVRFKLAAEVSLHIRSNLKTDEPYVAFRNGRSNRPAAANVEIKPAGNWNGLRLQRGDSFEWNVGASKIKFSFLFHGPVQNISGYQTLTAAFLSCGYPGRVAGRREQAREPIQMNSLCVHIIEREIGVEYGRNACARTMKSAAEGTFHGIVQTENLLQIGGGRVG